VYHSRFGFTSKTGKAFSKTEILFLLVIDNVMNSSIIFRRKSDGNAQHILAARPRRASNVGTVVLEIQPLDFPEWNSTTASPAWCIVCIPSAELGEARQIQPQNSRRGALRRDQVIYTNLLTFSE